MVGTYTSSEFKIKNHCQVHHLNLDLSDEALRKYSLNNSEISSVLYYNDWSSDADGVINSFLQASQRFCNQINYITVDCTKKQYCPKLSNGALYPLLQVHHRLYPSPITYGGPLKLHYMQEFYKTLISPITYVSSSARFFKLIQRTQFSVVVHIDPLKHHALSAYYQMALQTLNHYPSQYVEFGVVTCGELATKLRLVEWQVHVFDRRKEGGVGDGDPLPSPIELHDLRSFSSRLMYNKKEKLAMVFEEPNEWIVKKHLTQSMRGEKSNFLYKALTSADAAMLFFISDLDMLNAIESVAISYSEVRNEADGGGGQSCSCCCSSFSDELVPCETCVIDDSCKDRLSCSSPLLPTASTQTSTLLKTSYPPLKTTLKCDILAEVRGLRHRLNHTITFAVLDIAEYRSVWRSLGVGKATAGAVIVDVGNEDEYEMRKNLTEENIAEHIFRYSVGLFESTRTFHKPIVTSSLADDYNVATSNSNFKSQVLNSTADVLVLYTSPSCAACMIYDHYVADLRRFLRTSDVLTILRVDDRLNSHLEWPFYVDTFPSLILFPSTEPNDSIVFPSTEVSSISLKQLVSFLLQYGSQPTKSRIVLTLEQKLI